MAGESLQDLVRQLKRQRALFGRDEVAVKQGVILPLLQCLGWNPFDIEEVTPEYTVKGQRVDFALRDRSASEVRVFIEAKKASEELEKHQEQLLKYSFAEGVELAVLTNGVTWWFYLPTQKGRWDQRRFYTIEILDQDPAEVVQRFREFLLRDAVVTGQAQENARKVHRSRQKQQQIDDTLPKAWDKLIGEPEELLVDLLSETTEKLCGFQPERKAVKSFLGGVAEGVQPATPTKSIRVSKSGPKKLVGKSGSYTGTSVKSFVLLGRSHKADTYREVLTRACALLAEKHGARFDRVLELRGKKRPFFTRNPKELRAPFLLPGTDIYVEVNLSANMIVRLVGRAALLLGHPASSFRVHAGT